LKIDSVDQKFNGLVCGNFSQDAGMPGTESHCAFTAGGERVKERLLALVRDLFTFSSKVIKMFILV
jgi:hypothetical protein